MLQTITTHKKTSEKKDLVRQPSKFAQYNEFILWTAMPFSEKRAMGIERQGQFAEYYHVSEDTLTNWKKRADFEDRVDAILKIWATDKTPDVIHSIYKTAVKGNPLSQMLWLQYFKKFNPKKIEDDTPKVVLSPADIRHMIEQLLDQLKEKHYGYLRELAEDVVAWRDARDSEINNWHERPTTTVPDETDNDAQSIQVTGADAVAYRHTESLCSNMGTHTPRTARASESDNKSTAWRW